MKQVICPLCILFPNIFQLGLKHFTSAVPADTALVIDHLVTLYIGIPVIGMQAFMSLKKESNLILVFRSYF